ncbi:acyl carrier protein [Vibrio sp. 10N.261.52.C11]|uniref:acyl carrier protein n=1 Tax=Vibrio sp. 10N.261.52.C11 TaxID=3229680 RepID=UPI0035527AC0
MLNIEVVVDAMNAAGISIDADVAIKENQDLIFEDLGLDSLDLFNLFLELENLTGKAVPDEEIDNFKTISDILNKY